jgi:hypothetical protein
MTPVNDLVQVSFSNMFDGEIFAFSFRKHSNAPIGYHHKMVWRTTPHLLSSKPKNETEDERIATSLKSQYLMLLPSLPIYSFFFGPLYLATDPYSVLCLICYRTNRLDCKQATLSQSPPQNEKCYIYRVVPLL